MVMKTYQVFTTEEAESQLTTLWLNASSPERSQITQSSHFVDQYLKYGAEQKGTIYINSSPQLRFFAHKP